MSFFNTYPYTDFHELNLDWIIDKIRLLMQAVDSLDDWREAHAEEYKDLKTFYDNVLAGVFPESLKQAFHSWMLANAKDLVGSMIKNVWFGLTDTGYFVAYIPDSWNDLVFKTTGLDINLDLMPEYGHLVLQY